MCHILSLKHISHIQSTLLYNVEICSIVMRVPRNVCMYMSVREIQSRNNIIYYSHRHE